VAAAVTPDRPIWRGVIHRWAVIAFAPLFALLVVLADGTADRIATIVYALGVLGMLGVSATYHSGRLGPVGTRRLKRADHATILLAIAGSYTAVAAIGLDGTPARTLLVVVWIATPLAVALRMLWLDAPYPAIAVVYVVVGWMAVIEIGPLFDALTAFELSAIVVGGLLYTVGGVVYALHRPNPRPGVFGYHEVFHALVVGGVAAHYAAVLSLILRGR
jgi:hemolysin III